MRSLFVTGASGYMGRRLLRLALRDSERRVVVLVCRANDLPVDLRGAAGIEIVVGDLLSPAGWASTLAGCDAAIHLAAITGKARRREYVRVNTEGTRAFVQAAAAVSHLVNVSTIAVRFRDRKGYPYADSKEEAEDIVAQSGVPYTTVRPTMVFGPGAPVLDRLARLASLPIVPLFGGASVSVQPIWADDLADILLQLATKCEPRGGALDIGGPDQTPLRDLLSRLRSEWFGRPERSLRIPLAPVRGVLRVLEPLLLPLLPLTAGQLATFANDGTASPSEFMESRLPAMKRLGDMLDEARPVD